MAVGRVLRLTLLLGVLWINLDMTSRRGIVHGQTQETLPPCLFANSQGSDINDTNLGNLSDLNLNCSTTTIDVEMASMGNNTSAGNEVNDDNNSMEAGSQVNVIDTGSIGRQTNDSILMACNLIINPILVFFGLIGNVLSLRTLLRQKPRDAIKVYLISLSVTDILVLTLGGIFFVKEYLDRYHPAAGARMRAAIFGPIDLFAYIVITRMSAYLTVVLSLERTIAVTLPFKVKRILLNRHPWKVVIFLYVALILFFVPYLFRYEVLTLEDESTGRLSVVIIPSEFSRSGPLFFIYFGLVAQILTTILPMMLVIISNLITLISLRASARHRKEMLTNQKEDYKITRLLLTISAIFLACSSPSTINYVVVKFVPSYGFNQKEHYLYTALIAVVTTLVILNSTINFIVYMFLSETFRKTFFETWGFAYRLRNWTKSEAMSSDAGGTDVNTQHSDVPVL